ncbi:pinopsin-like [Schistocerca cancellata]|uniref:pinopsin-like n=1 Tax=Schistocerca cancellata TaxID=274614 RepID=UPI002117E313|nr:pinopsin-like [Schistocerca cancellata]
MRGRGTPGAAAAPSRLLHMDAAGLPACRRASQDPPRQLQPAVSGGEAALWTPLNVILFNLVCSDFSVALLGNPLTLAAAVAHRWIFGRTMCVVYGFFMSLLGISSIATLTVLAFERYVMISRPFQARRLSRRGAALLVAAIWLYSLLLTAPPLLGWGDYVHEAANISCSVNWESRTLGATSYIVFLFAMGLVVPVAVISFSYLNIVRTLKKNTLRLGRATRAESRVALMVAVMIAAFLLAWTPYSALALLIAFGDHRLVSPGLAVVPALVAKSSICYNPLIYVGLNTQVRRAPASRGGAPGPQTLCGARRAGQVN